jgi:hypothetical protein
MQKGYQKIPYPLGTEEWKSFLNFAKAFYREAVEIAKASSVDMESYRALLNATVSPLVYVWEQWQIMPSDKKLAYATEEYKKTLEKIMQEAKKVAQQIGKV